MVSVMPSKAPSLYPPQSRLLRDLGLRLREARLRRRLSVSQVAERTEVSRPTLNKVEKGDPAVTLGKLLLLLNLTYQLLAGRAMLGYLLMITSFLGLAGFHRVDQLVKQLDYEYFTPTKPT